MRVWSSQLAASSVLQRGEPESPGAPTCNTMAMSQFDSVLVLVVAHYVGCVLPRAGLQVHFGLVRRLCLP